MGIRSSELVFVKSVKDGIPNRDPLNDSNARRLFGEEDGRISLSDVSIKRDVRDYVAARYPNGGDEKRNYIFVREERTEKGKLLGRSSLAETLKEKAGIDEDDMKKVLCQVAFDVRVFGAVFSVKKQNFQLTGPVQFGWAHSLHPAETIYTQGTVVMPSKDITDTDEGKTQGTIWTTYVLPFGVFAMPAVMNAHLAEQTTMNEDDVELLLEGLWRGTQHRQARGRGMQQPLFMLHVEYNDMFFRIGYLEEGVKLNPDRDQWLGDTKPSTVQEIQLDVSGLSDKISQYRQKISRCRYWLNPSLEIIGDVPGEAQDLW